MCSFSGPDPLPFYRSIMRQVREGKVLEILEEDLETRGTSIGSAAYWASENGIRCLYDVMRRRMIFADAQTFQATPWPEKTVSRCSREPVAVQG